MPLIQAIEFVAVMVSAIYGILLASRKGMDFVGLFCVAFAVAFGGGSLRDLFLDRHPLFWIANGHYVICVFGLSLVGAVIPRVLHRLERYLPIPDAMGMSLFTVLGTSYALEYESPLFIASIIGVITGTFGGVIADIICNEVPSLFKPATTFYATCSFAGSWSFLTLHWLGQSETVCMFVGATITFAFRLLAMAFNWRLPAAQISSEPTKD
jgi:uncharacterized membrane protein YeiH